MREMVNILGVNVDKVTFDQAVDKAERLVHSERTAMLFTPNPEIIMLARKDCEMRGILNRADLCTADGIGVVYGTKILGKPVPHRVAGFDLACALMERLARSGDGVFLFGAKPDVAETAKRNLEEMYPGLVITGTQNGYFRPEDEDEIINSINQSGAKLLLVCLGAPKQEKWIAKNQEKLNVGLCMGVGGTLDVLAGNVKRAPKLFIRLNLEWAYRFITNPTRIKRFFVLPQFVIEVIKEKYNGKGKG